MRPTTQGSLPVTLELDLKEERLSHADLIRLVLQFVKHLLFQRKQIPSSIDAIRIDVETKPSTAAARDPQTTTGGSASLRGGPASVQEKLRRKRLADKQSRTREKYLTRAKTFLDSYQALEDDICRHLDQQTTTLACIFGASPAHPKEVYTIELPSPTDWLPPSSERAYRKASLALFRGLTSSEELFKVLSANIMSTGFFIAMKKPSTARRDGLVHRPGFKYPPLAKTRHAIITIRQNRAMTIEETPIRPSFKPSKPLMGSTSVCTPIPMDICTPLVTKGRSSSRKYFSMTPSGASSSYVGTTMSDLMLETPCVKRKCTREIEEERKKVEDFSPMVIDTEMCENGGLKNSSPVPEILSADSELEWLFLPLCLKGFIFPRA